MQDRHPSSQQNEQGINANYVLQVGATIFFASVTMLIIWRNNATLRNYLGYVTDNGVTRAIKARLTYFGDNNTQKPASAPIIKPTTVVDETPEANATESKPELPDAVIAEVSATPEVTLLPVENNDKEKEFQQPEVVEDDEDYDIVRNHTTADGNEKEDEVEIAPRRLSM